VHPLWWNFQNYRKFCVPFAKDFGFSLSTERRRPYGSLFATIQRNSSICFSGKIGGRPDELPVGFRPVCFISCVNNWHVSLVIRKWFTNSPNKYAGIVTSKYPFTRVDSLRIKQAATARSVTSSLLSRMVQLIVSQSPYSKAAKMFKKSAIFKHNKVSPSIPWGCRARDFEFWEAVGRVPFEQRKLQKCEPVIFVEWKAPYVSLRHKRKIEQY